MTIPPKVPTIAGMRLNQIAQRLSNLNAHGMSPELAKKLGVKSDEATRGQLMALEDDDHGHLGVYLLGIYVVDDTDFWDDGEIYWFSVPTLVDKKGRATWSPLTGVVTGEPPHKCGSLEWMTNVALSDPPLLALIPPDDDIASCVVRFSLFDDDKKPADMPKAIAAGLEQLAQISRDPIAAGTDAIIMPVRDAVLTALIAKDDDVLMDQDVTFRRGEASRFQAGLVTSEMNQMSRVYFLVRDERKTEQAGPVTLHKGQAETLQFKSPLKVGGRVSFFARGSEVTVTALGTLTTDSPFLNRTLEAGTLAIAKDGFAIHGSGAAKVVAFYTPP